LRLSLDADETPVHGMIGVSGDPGDFPVLKVDDNAAIAVASLADTSDFLFHVCPFL
jgi:hypothetical protein